MAHRINLQQRAFRLGYLRGLRKARAELRELTVRMDAELANLADEIGEIATDYQNVKDIAEAMVERASMVRLH
jgi:hypothetical protein